ncbi:MAG: MiaB/RimO family radical SAM methylthiotransferase [Phycisphaeraceae bacterium]|nr:MiaB/RimO family radical SAM methylthiotransferase [Phycisphaeraceae bacterium]
MNQNNDNSRSVYMETFGCQMNVLDTQLVKSQLLGLGYYFIDDWKKADVILYNTCSVREHAEQKVYSRIGRVAKHKKTTNSHVVLGVIGCMAEREGTGVASRYPDIDLLCGPGELDKVPMLIDNVIKTNPDYRGGKRGVLSALQGNTHRRSSTFAAAEDELEMLDLARSFSPDDHTGSAYVRITRGCNKFCTYCVVPNTRGAEVHRPPNNIVEECKKLVDSGVIEITLLGQTVNHYHYDNAASPITTHGLAQSQVGSVMTVNGTRQSSDDMTSFADLLYRIHEEVPGLQRLRFVTSFPRDFGDDILQVIRDSPRICQYLHLPVQSGSDRILKLMNRDYTVSMYEDLLGRVRSYLPESQIASDFICGFPTETQEDHQMTADLLRRSLFKNCFIFKYSPRPGTSAIDRFEDDVDEATKKRRNNELLDIQNLASTQVHNEMIGKSVRVFVESLSKQSQKEAVSAVDPSITLGWEKSRQTIQLCGRTDGDLIVMLDGDESMIGSIVQAQIQSAMPLTLFGKVLSTPVG